MKTNNRRGGLTLVEIIICLAIIGLLASIAGTYVKAKEAGKAKGATSSVVMMGGGTYIQFNPIRQVSESASFASVFSEVRGFETNHPNLKITGRQVIADSSWIRGVIIWHEPRRDEPGR